MSLKFLSQNSKNSLQMAYLFTHVFTFCEGDFRGLNTLKDTWFLSPPQSVCFSPNFTSNHWHNFIYLIIQKWCPSSSCSWYLQWAIPHPTVVIPVDVFLLICFKCVFLSVRAIKSIDMSHFTLHMPLLCTICGLSFPNHWTILDAKRCVKNQCYLLIVDHRLSLLSSVA